MPVFVGAQINQIEMQFEIISLYGQSRAQFSHGQLRSPHLTRPTQQLNAKSAAATGNAFLSLIAIYD